MKTTFLMGTVSCSNSLLKQCNTVLKYINDNRLIFVVQNTGMLLSIKCNCMLLLYVNEILIMPKWDNDLSR